MWEAAVTGAGQLQSILGLNRQTRFPMSRLSFTSAGPTQTETSNGSSRCDALAAVYLWPVFQDINCSVPGSDACVELHSFFIYFRSLVHLARPENLEVGNLTPWSRVDDAASLIKTFDSPMRASYAIAVSLQGLLRRFILERMTQLARAARKEISIPWST